MHPYSNLKARNFWNKFVARAPWRDLALGDTPKFQLHRTDRIATAGSCFAQHISRYLAAAGCGTYIAEPVHPYLAHLQNEVDSYRLFSARYGNVYTARQGLELFRQAFGQMPMIEDFAQEAGRWYDLLRPNAVPAGFATLAEARADRAYHLTRVKAMFETADAFVFTLGLTECWYHAKSGHTYPTCPGTARGEYDPQLHQFRNMTYPEVLADMEALLAGLADVNPRLKIILTVSPVPLVATYTDKNVLVASSYSKSVLRAVAGEIDARYPNVQYFPSYEIISHAASFGQYLESDLRGVAQRGVDHVMSCFLATLLASDAPAPAAAAAPSAAPAPAPAGPSHEDLTAKFLSLECEEIFNEVP
jgi:hypothetical protein